MKQLLASAFLGCCIGVGATLLYVADRVADLDDKKEPKKECYKMVYITQYGEIIEFVDGGVE